MSLRATNVRDATRRFRLLAAEGRPSHESHVCGTDVISATKVTGESLCATSRNHVRGARKLRVGRAKPHKAAR